MSVNLSRIETLNRDNYDTWKMQMEALLVKNDAWNYVNGECKTPAIAEGNEAVVKAWFKNDSKAKSDIVLSISPSELKQIKGCATSRSVWLKLESIYMSKGPARKASLLKQLTLLRMEDGGDIREHVNKFYDAVDKLQEMEVDINPDLLTIMMLYSLPSSFENFRCAIESRDELPTPDALRVKVIEESDARNNGARASDNAMFAHKSGTKRWRPKGGKAETGNVNPGVREAFKFRCHKCREVGHKAADCRNKNRRQQSAASGSVEADVFSVSEALLSVPTEQSNKWCLDSGATSHLCNRLQNFSEINGSNLGKLNLANCASTEITGKGTALLTVNVSGEIRDVTLSNTLHVPDLRTNLLSVGKITDKGFVVVFKQKTAEVIGSDGKVRLIADRIGELYFVREHKQTCNSATSTECVSQTRAASLETWHKRLGHLNIRDILNANRNGIFQGLDPKLSKDNFQCDICCRGKLTRTPFPKQSTRKSELLELVHSDLCGPMRFASNGNAKYFVTFIDDYSRWCEVRFLKSKGEAFSNFREFKQMAETQKEKKIKCLQSDNGTEYRNSDFDAFLTTCGISRRLTVPYNPEQNGVAERKNRTLLDCARCLLMQSGLPPSFWAEAVCTANYIRNRCPTKSLGGRTPYEAWTGKKPDIKDLRIFGCRVFCMTREPGRSKFEPRGKEGIFIGYSDQSKGFRIWLPSEKKIVITRDVKFLEESESKTIDFVEFTPQNSLYEPEDVLVPEQEKREVEIVDCTPEVVKNDDEPGNTKSDDDEPPTCVEEPSDIKVQTPRRGPGRPRKVLSGKRGRPRKTPFEVHAESRIANEECAFTAEISMKQAVSGPDADEWFNAMAVEIKSIIKNDTWTIVDRPKNEEVIGSRIVLRNKYKSNGVLERRKARVVAQGFAQRPGVHFHQTFAPVARLSSIRLLTALAARNNMFIRQFDVATAYLNGELEEKILMEPPKLLNEILEIIVKSEKKGSKIEREAKKMMDKNRHGNKVCLLNRSLYGLRQAGRSWNVKIDGVLRKYGANPTNADPCVYHLRERGESILIAVYVDDILVASRNSEAIARIGNHLSSEFEIKDIGEVGYCLGIEFTRKGKKINMHQKGYIAEILERFGMSDSNPVKSPMDPNVKLTKPDKPPDEDELRLPYRELIGALMYLSVATRPDVSFAVSNLSQYNSCFRRVHWNAAKRVLRYLKGTSHLGLVFEPNSEPLKGYVDADWGSCLNDRRSYTGFVFILSGGPISWDSKKQRTVALSSTEAEYMSMTEAVKEAMYLREFLTELNYKELAEVTVYNDNQGAKKLAENAVFHSRTKHIDLRHHFVREALKMKKLKIEHIPTEDMVADILTKGLAGPKHRICLDLMNLGVDPETREGLRLEGKC